VTHTCRLYGLDVRSPFVLGHLAPGAGDPDVRISVDDARITVDPSTALPGRLMAAYAPDMPHFVLFDRGAEGYFHRIYNVVDMVISPDTRDIRCRLVVDAPAAVLPVMLTGHVLARRCSCAASSSSTPAPSRWAATPSPSSATPEGASPPWRRSRAERAPGW